MARMSREELEKSQAEKEKTEKESKENIVLVPRAVSVAEMFNVISDKLDLILEKLESKE